MTAIQPPRWTADQLEGSRKKAIALFRKSRMEEPLEAYLDAFDKYRDAMEDLLEKTVDLTQLESAASEVLSDPSHLEAVRYLPGPPISADDLKILSEASLAPGRLLRDTEMARRVMGTILLGVDRARFPWLSENREPSEEERSAATLASAVLMAYRRVMTARANESKGQQEEAVSETLCEAGLEKVHTRTIHTLTDSPEPGHFCGECLFGERKADLVVRLWDGRAMPIECKVSNSYTNSVKRLNNDAQAKARYWVQAFGTAQVVPSAVLTGVYKRHNLEQAQDGGLTLFWSHALADLTDFIARATLK